MKLEFPQNPQILNFIKSVQWELFHADGRTDLRKLIVAFCNFAKAPRYRAEKDRPEIKI
jgi:hypothetical protein